MKHTLLSPGQSVRETTYVLLMTQLSNSSVALTHSVHTRPASSVVGRRTSVVGRDTAVACSSNCNVKNFTGDAAMTLAGNELPITKRSAKQIYTWTSLKENCVDYLSATLSPLPLPESSK